MAQENHQIVYSKVAHQQILAAMIYIARHGYPETALKFADAIYDFGQSLSIFPEKYALCKRRPFSAKNFRCAPFEHYVFVYHVEANRTTIHAFIHSSRIR